MSANLSWYINDLPKELGELVGPKSQETDTASHQGFLCKKLR
jgi:hypothetical protein